MDKLGRDIILLGLISFFTDASSEAIMPILPFFIYSIGGTGLIVGLIMGFGDGIASISKVFSGILSDKIGKRKIFISAGYSLSSISKLFFPLSIAWWHMFFLRSVERIGKGLRGAPRDALIGELYVKRRGEAYGIHRAMDTAGAVVGSFLAFFLFWFFHLNIKTILIIAAIISFLALPPIIFVRDVKFRASKKKGKLSKNLRKFILISTIFYLGNFSYAFFLLRIGIEFEKAVAFAILLYAFFNVIYATSASYFGKLSDIVGRKIIIFFGYTLFAFICFGFIFIKHSSIYSIIFSIFLFILYGLMHAFIEGNQRALVSDLSEYKGTAQGYFQMATGMAVIPANIIAGILWDIKPELTFLYGSMLAILSSILLANYEA